jgi:hypothetical protein
MPAELAERFVPVWRRYNLELARDPDVLGACAVHCNQASLSLALAAHPVPFREAPLSLNFPLHLTDLEAPEAMLATDPAILHYHQEVDADGFLLASPYPLAQARIEAFNRRFAEERRVTPIPEPAAPAGSSVPLRRGAARQG